MNKIGTFLEASNFTKVFADLYLEDKKLYEEMSGKLYSNRVLISKRAM
jgi:hypothetical protein